MSEERLSSALITISNAVGVDKFGDPRVVADRVIAKFKAQRARADETEHLLAQIDEWCERTNTEMDLLELEGDPS